MLDSIRIHIKQQRESIEKQAQMKERELLMETHLKEAQLKYLQAQINPHFLFNCLNAGAQLAMLEDAERTGVFLEKMADFFRYNVRKMEDDALLWEEVDAVDNYIYILNVHSRSCSLWISSRTSSSSSWALRARALHCSFFKAAAIRRIASAPTMRA